MRRFTLIAIAGFALMLAPGAQAGEGCSHSGSHAATTSESGSPEGAVATEGDGGSCSSKASGACCCKGAEGGSGGCCGKSAETDGKTPEPSMSRVDANETVAVSR